jgi:uncharacterized protein
MDAYAAILTVGFYAGLNGLVLMGLATHVGNTRRRLGISIGDAGNAEMIRAMRGQANFVELVPYCLILLLLLALAGAPLAVLHLLGTGLTLGRIAHAAHFVQADAPGWQRATGALLSVLVLFLASAGLIGLAVAEVA